MRIIAGRFKGRVLRGPVGRDVRPTTDGLRETLFNVLRDRVEGASVLDAFAGTGAVGLEAISRGARHATFIEQDRRMVAVLQGNIDLCGAGDQATVVRESFLNSRTRRGMGPFDVIFADPPYEIPNLDAVVTEAAGLIAAGGVFVLEHSRRRQSPTDAGGAERHRILVAGDSALSFYSLAPPTDTMDDDR